MRFKALFGLLCALWLGTLSPVAAQEAQVHRRDIPSNYKMVWSEEGNSFSKRTGGPSRQGLLEGGGVWSLSSWLYGVYDCRGHDGTQAEYFMDQQLCPQGGGYPADSQVTAANGALTITGETTPASLGSFVPGVSYSPFTHTCSITGTDMACTVATSGVPKTYATITGTGVTAGTQITAYGTNATPSGCTPTCHYTVTPSQTVASTAISSTGKWGFVSAQLNTGASVFFKPDKGVCWESRIWLDGKAGAWGALWTQRQDPTVFTTTLAQAEVDQPEGASIFGVKWHATNFHWQTTDGGTYNSSNTENFARTAVYDGWHTYRFCADSAGNADYWTDGSLVNHYKIPSNAIGWWGHYQYFILNMHLGNDGNYPGIFTGAQSATMKVDYIRLFMPQKAVGASLNSNTTADYVVDTTADFADGPDSIASTPNNNNDATGSWSWFSNGSTDTNGGTVDGYTEVSIASNNQTWHGREFSGNANTAWIVRSGNAYKITVGYNFGTSNKATFQINQSGSAAMILTVSSPGGSPTVPFGTCASAADVAVASHRELSCTFTATNSEGLGVRVMPDTTTVGQNVKLYFVKVRKQ